MRPIFAGASYNITSPDGEVFPLPSFVFSGNTYQGYSIIYQPYPIDKININHIADSSSRIIIVATSIWTGSSFSPVPPTPLLSVNIPLTYLSLKFRINDKPIVLSPINVYITEISLSVQFTQFNDIIMTM